VSVLVVAQSSSEIPEGLKNNPVLCLLCSVSRVFVSMNCLIFLAARYLKVICIFVFKYLTAFSVSLINSKHQNKNN